MTTIDPRKYRCRPDSCMCEVSQYLVGVKSFDELMSQQFGVYGRRAVSELAGDTSNLTVHHIFGGTGRRNYLSNLITAHAFTHLQWGHGFPQQFRVVCLLAKKRKGEFSLKELNAAAGLDHRPGASVLGRIETYDLEPPFSEWREELTA